MTKELVKKLKIELFKIILWMRFLHQINLKNGFYLTFRKSSSNYDTRMWCTKKVVLLLYTVHTGTIQPLQKKVTL